MKQVDHDKFSLLVYFLIIVSSSYASSTSLLSDTDFLQGFSVIDPGIEDVYVEPPQYKQVGDKKCRVYRNKAKGSINLLSYGNQGMPASPKWTVAQWQSRAGLSSDQGSYVKGAKHGAYQWKNSLKGITVGKLGSGYKGITLSVNGAEEYRGKWVQFDDVCRERPHPHLTLSQVPPPMPLGAMKRLDLSLSVKVNKASINSEYSANWDKVKTTAHFLVILNVQNIRADKDRSKGHSQSFGLLINLYDVRNRDSDYAEGPFLHKPQRRYMLKLGLVDLGPHLRGKLHGGAWAEVKNVDLLPFVKKAFSKSIFYSKQPDSYIDELISKDLNDYRITSVNFGWEVSSLHDVEMHVQKLELDAK